MSGTQQYGMRQKPSGRIGNQLFQLNLLLQLEAQLTEPGFRRGFNLEGLEAVNPNLISASLFKYHRHELISKNWVNNNGFEALIERIHENGGSKKTSIIESGILGKIFFESSKIHPYELLKPLLKPSLFEKINLSEGKTVAVHFRGSDFATWNPRADMKFDFYQRAIEYCRHKYSNSCSFTFSTDDTEHEVAIKIAKYIGVGIEKNNSPHSDFKKLLNADVVIAGPSTFTFWSGVLSKNTDLIMDLDWFDYCFREEDKFWMDVFQNYSKFSGSLELV